MQDPTLAQPLRAAVERLEAANVRAANVHGDAEPPLDETNGEVAVVPREPTGETARTMLGTALTQTDDDACVAGLVEAVQQAAGQ